MQHNASPVVQSWANQSNTDACLTALRRWLCDTGKPPVNGLGEPLSSMADPVSTFMLPNEDIVTCVFWNGRHYITGTDIVKILLFRFIHIGRQVLNTKKFEEGVFSDLRRLKPGLDAVLEEPKSDFLNYLYKHNCIRTQKKQKVFYWHKVPHEALFKNAMERDLRREIGLYSQYQLQAVASGAFPTLSDLERAAVADDTEASGMIRSMAMRQLSRSQPRKPMPFTTVPFTTVPFTTVPLASENLDLLDVHKTIGVFDSSFERFCKWQG
jgi:transcription factor STE12